MQPQAFYTAVADDFTAVDHIIKKQLTSRVPLVSKIGDYITSAGGKRLRPLLVLLCGKALGSGGDDLRLLAATIEFLCCTTTWSTCPACAVAAPPPTPCGATRPAYW
jgi:octaprenyl-diphosphate synthase